MYIYKHPCSKICSLIGSTWFLYRFYCSAEVVISTLVKYNKIKGNCGYNLLLCMLITVKVRKTHEIDF